MEAVRTIIISFATGLVAAMLFVVLHNHLYQDKSIATVNIKSILADQLSVAGEREWTEEEAQASAGRFSAALDKAINDISNEHHVLLLVSPAVVSGAPDYTDLIERRVQEIMNAAPRY